MPSPRAHLRIDFSATCSIGPGKIALLEAIARTGSLSAAGRELDMSYRRAWLLLHNVNQAFAEPAVRLSVGGKSGGGAQLTAFGHTLVATYRQFEQSVADQAAQAFTSLTPSAGPPVEPTATRRPLRRQLAPPTSGKPKAS